MERYSKYSMLIGPSNLNSDYAKPVTVYATSRSEAISRGVEIGFSGRSHDARVWIRNVEDLDPRECPHVNK